jgi:hypothetical protein
MPLTARVAAAGSGGDRDVRLLPRCGCHAERLGMVLVKKPLCSRCKALIVATGKGEIINKEQVKQ